MAGPGFSLASRPVNVPWLFKNPIYIAAIKDGQTDYSFTKGFGAVHLPPPYPPSQQFHSNMPSANGTTNGSTRGKPIPDGVYVVGRPVVIPLFSLQFRGSHQTTSVPFSPLSPSLNRLQLKSST